MNEPKLDEAAGQLKLFPVWLRMQYPATVGNIHCQKMEEQIDDILTALSSLQAECERLDRIYWELKTECEKLREDKEMLDWLQNKGRVCRFTDGWNAWVTGNSTGTASNDLREAIRNAMKGT